MAAFEKTETIRFRHCDKAGIVFYPRYFEMWNDLVEEWFAEALDLPFAVLHRTHGIPTVQLTVQFKKPATLGETLRKQLWVTQLGSASITLGMQYLDAQGAQILHGTVTLVFVKLTDKEGAIQSEKLSDALKAKIAPFLLD